MEAPPFKTYRTFPPVNGTGETGPLTTLPAPKPITRRVSKVEWLRRLSSEMLIELPSPTLRSCWALGQSYVELLQHFFYAAFVSSKTALRSSQLSGYWITSFRATLPSSSVSTGFAYFELHTFINTRRDGAARKSF